MKVSYVTMQFPVPSETFASLDVESLRKQGCEVSVYCMRPKHRAFTKLVKERGHFGLSISHLSWRALVKVLIFFFKHPVMVLCLAGWIVRCCFKAPVHLFKSLVLFPSAISIFGSLLESKPQVVHLFWGHYPSMVGYLVNKYMPDTVLSMFLGAHDLISAYPGSASLSNNADVIFTHSNSNLELISEMGVDVDRVRVVLRGTKLDFPVNGSIEKFSRVQDPVILAAGRLIEDKGFDDVLRVFKEFSSIYSSATLKIAGDGPFKSSLERIASDLGIEDKIFFMGHLDQVSLLKLMSEAHFFLLMSRHPSERLPNVVKEAMYQKCIVVTTRTPGIEELISTEVSGFVVEKGDFLAASRCLLSCVQGEKSPAEIAGAAGAHIEKEFNVDVSMKKYIYFWQIFV